MGEGDLDFGQGGIGDPPVEEPSGEGRSIEGEGEGEGVSERGEGGGIKELEVERGVSGLEAPGEMEVGRGSRVAGVEDRSGDVCE